MPGGGWSRWRWRWRSRPSRRLRNGSRSQLFETAEAQQPRRRWASRPPGESFPVRPSTTCRRALRRPPPPAQLSALRRQRLCRERRGRPADRPCRPPDVRHRQRDRQGPRAPVHDDGDLLRGRDRIRRRPARGGAGACSTASPIRPIRTPSAAWCSRARSARPGASSASPATVRSPAPPRASSGTGRSAWRWPRWRVRSTQPVGLATHYHTIQIHPYWADSLTNITTIGAHTFYRWKGAAGLAAAFTDRYAPAANRCPRATSRPAIPTPSTVLDPIQLARTYEQSLCRRTGVGSSAGFIGMAPGARRLPPPVYSAEIQSRGGEALYSGDRLPGAG